AIVSSLPYYCNTTVGHVARKVGLHYFDLTEDVSVTEAIKRISEGAETAFAPQCGLAPGFISIVANELMTHFDQVNDVRMRVGALPQNPNNALKYSLTWSTEGLINEYGNLCFGIDNYKPASLMPLEGLESIEIDGKKYEAFNTSGGLGSLAETYEGQIRKMNYKTIRYPGHCVQMRLLMNDLKLNEDRKTFRRILENAIPRTVQDVVIIYASVTGRRDGHLIEENYVNKVYPKLIGERLWSAIQVTTAAGVCAVLDLVIRDPGQYTGFVPQESFNLKDVLDNRFGRYFAHGGDMTESARLVATNEVRSVM
ncbi:MAG: saccharopine dehydrogenase C-terminal domain-containing protein, partial [Gammaproteobacteria bacterium]